MRPMPLCKGFGNSGNNHSEWRHPCSYAIWQGHQLLGAEVTSAPPPNVFDGAEPLPKLMGSSCCYCCKACQSTASGMRPARLLAGLLGHHCCTSGSWRQKCASGSTSADSRSVATETCGSHMSQEHGGSSSSCHRGDVAYGPWWQQQQEPTMEAELPHDAQT